VSPTGDWCRTLNYYGRELFRGGINKKCRVFSSLH
jgi:hypothetical protein